MWGLSVRVEDFRVCPRNADQHGIGFMVQGEFRVGS
jgi:hypothetical protein